jgi:transcriptional regulator with XRE-family HTH domain
MDIGRVGRSIRAIRIRLGWRQQDLADAARVSRSFVSKLERGLVGRSDLERIERICRALGADLDVRVRWRGEGLDRLLDEAHAALVERTVQELRSSEWEVALEVTFNDFGDRGSVDLVGWHPIEAALLIVEVKSVVPDAQGTLMPLDRKTRIGPKIARDRGWAPRTVSRLLVVGDQMVNRRRIARLASTFDVALPVRGHAVRRWLRGPTESLAGLLFLSVSPYGSAGRTLAGRQRVNRPRKAQSGLG